MSESDKEDGEVLSDGELEDGELPSSEDEEGTTKNEELPNDPPESPTGSQPESQEAHAALKRPAPEDEAGAAESSKPEPKVVSSTILFLCHPFTIHTKKVHPCFHIVRYATIFGDTDVTKFSITVVQCTNTFLTFQYVNSCKSVLSVIASLATRSVYNQLCNTPVICPIGPRNRM